MLQAQRVGGAQTIAQMCLIHMRVCHSVMRAGLRARVCPPANSFLYACCFCEHIRKSMSLRKDGHTNLSACGTVSLHACGSRRVLLNSVRFSWGVVDCAGVWLTVLCCGRLCCAVVDCAEFCAVIDGAGSRWITCCQTLTFRARGRLLTFVKSPPGKLVARARDGAARKRVQLRLWLLVRIRLSLCVGAYFPCLRVR